MTSNDPVLDDLPVTTEQSQSYLNQRQLQDYRAQRRACFRRLLSTGKDPGSLDDSTGPLLLSVKRVLWLFTGRDSLVSSRQYQYVPALCTR